jgi:hypothetical protein
MRNGKFTKQYAVGILTSQTIRKREYPSHPHLRFPPADTLEALAMNNGGTGFVILLLRAPQVLEGGEGGQDGSTDPDGILPLGRSDDLDLFMHGSEFTRSKYHNRVNEPSCSMGRGRQAPSAYGRRYRGTWWYHQTRRCFRIDHDGYQDRTCRSSYRSSRGYHGLQDRAWQAGRGPQEHGIYGAE